MSTPAVTGPSPVAPTVAPTTEETTTAESPSVEAKYTSFSKALIPAPKTDKWYMTALKVLSCITIVPMLGALIMDGLRGFYNWITTTKSEANEEEAPEATPEAPEDAPAAAPAAASVKTRVVALAKDHPKSAASVAVAVLSTATYFLVL